MVTFAASIVRPPTNRQPSRVVLATVMVLGQVCRLTPVCCQPVQVSSGTAGNGRQPVSGPDGAGAVGVGGWLGLVVGLVVGLAVGPAVDVAAGAAGVLGTAVG